MLSHGHSLQPLQNLKLSRLNLIPVCFEKDSYRKKYTNIEINWFLQSWATNFNAGLLNFLILVAQLVPAEKSKA